jgi:SHAQKYF class myb-like DNA-binding protein
MAAPMMTPEEWEAAVRAVQPAPAAPGSRLAGLLNVSNEALLTGGKSGTALHGQCMTANAEALISSYRAFLQTVTVALRSHAPLLPAAERENLLRVHDPYPDALPATPLRAAEDARLLNFLSRAMLDLETGILACKTRAVPKKHMQRARSVSELRLSEMRPISSSRGSPRGSSCEVDLASPRGEGLLSGSGGEERCGLGAAADDCALADDAGAGLAAGRWTELEHAHFLEGMRLFGKNWRAIADHIKTRSPLQTRTHAQKHFVKEARAGVGLIAKADAAAAPNIFTMNQPSERLLQQEQQSQSARAAKRAHSAASLGSA